MKLIISLEVEKNDAITGADLSQLISHVLAVRDLAHGGRVHPQPEASRPEPPAPARREPDRGDAWEPPTDDDQDAPTDGRQLLGWARKQQPDAMGTLLSYGKRNGLHSKIVAWTPEQVRAAYRHARGIRPSTGR